MEPVRVAIVGIGNCASALVQGIEYYRRSDDPGGARTVGLMHLDLGGLRPWDLEIVAAFDVDERKVGRPLREALFAPPNCTQVFFKDLSNYILPVEMGPVLDGVSEHMLDHPPERSFRPSGRPPCDLEATLRKSRAEVLVNYLPVGSEQAARRYAQACLDAGVGMVNCMPVFLASDREWAERFGAARQPIVGDDIKSQVGATIVHRTLVQLFEDRGGKVDRTYQLNTGGNTDFLNMLSRERLRSKRISKTEAVQALLGERLHDDDIHIGPSDYVPWQKDNKVCFLRIEGRGFGGVPMHLELRLSVEDSPNSAGVAIDAIRACALARRRGLGGPILAASACAMKHPPRQFPDHVARAMLEDFIAGKSGA